MAKPIKIIDLFAGPGGLGEGFSNCKANSPFEIAMSVEFEVNAHKTLTLRALYRRLTKSERKDYYYPYIKSVNSKEKQVRFQTLIDACANKWRAAQHETMGSPHALGNPKKWEKIKAGIKPSEKDNEPTRQESAIYDRISKLRQEHDGPVVVIGGPPCQAYSVNGRNRIKAEKDYKPENDERFFLYQEYLKILDRAQPDIFIMENVEGILTAKLADGKLIFDQIKRELVRPNNIPTERYDIYSMAVSPKTAATKTSPPEYSDDHHFVLKASDFGVPQGRKRVILLGIKRKHGPVKKLMGRAKPGSTPSVGELIGALPKLRSGLSQAAEGPDTSEQWKAIWSANRDGLVRILSDKLETSHVVERWIALNKKEQKKSKKPDFTAGEIKAKKIGYTREVGAALTKALEVIKRLKLTKLERRNEDSKGSDYFLSIGADSTTFKSDFKNKYSDLYNWLHKDIEGVANHRTRGHMKADLARYMFSAAWAKANRKSDSPSPKSKDFPKAISPNHKNWETGNHADRFRTIEANMVPLTITSHLRKDGHAQIHYDASQNRSLTVREAARIQTFPDDYYFEGTQGWQFQQVGNAVPSYLAKQIALHVLAIMKDNNILEN